MPKKAAVIFSLFLIFFSLNNVFSASLITPNRPVQEQYFFDFANILSDNLVKEINKQGHGLKQSFDIDFVVVIIPALAGREIEEYATDLFSQWEIGKNTQGKKGILIFLAAKEQKIKIEVGYDLEEIYTDLYIGQVEREILKEFLEQADWERGFLATIENFVEKTYQINKKGIAVKKIAAQGSAGYYSGGAGAKTVFDFGAALKKPLPQTPDDLRAYFGAQPSPELAFQRYLEFCARNMNDYTLDIFSDLSKEFFKGWATSSGQRRSEVEEISGLPYEVRHDDKHALVLFPNPDIEAMRQHPMYLIVKSHKGWQMDLSTMTRVFFYAGNACTMIRRTHPYSKFIMTDYNFTELGWLINWNNDEGVFAFNIYGSDEGKSPGIEIYVWDEEFPKKSGLKTGDRILAIDGNPVKNGSFASNHLERYKAGDKVRFTLLRDGKKMNVDLTAYRHLDAYKDFRKCLIVPRIWIGAYFGPTTEVEQKVVSTGESYCTILEIYPGGPADKAGLRPGDIVLKLNNQETHIYEYDLLKTIFSLKPGDKVKMQILRGLKEKKNITITPEETLHKGYF